MSYAVAVWKETNDERYIGPFRKKDTAEEFAVRICTKLGPSLGACVVDLGSAWNYELWTELQEWADA